MVLEREKEDTVKPAIAALQLAGLFPDGLCPEASCSDSSSGSENESLTGLQKRKRKNHDDGDDGDDDGGGGGDDGDRLYTRTLEAVSNIHRIMLNQHTHTHTHTNVHTNTPLSPHPPSPCLHPPSPCLHPPSPPFPITRFPHHPCSPSPCLHPLSPLPSCSYHANPQHHRHHGLHPPLPSPSAGSC